MYGDNADNKAADNEAADGWHPACQSWGNLARTYFTKSASWFYHKMDGRDGNNKPTEFNAEERAQLKGALTDLSDRIRRAADSIEI